MSSTTPAAIIHQAQQGNQVALKFLEVYVELEVEDQERIDRILQNWTDRIKQFGPIQAIELLTAIAIFLRKKGVRDGNKFSAAV